MCYDSEVKAAERLSPFPSKVKTRKIVDGNEHFPYGQDRGGLPAKTSMDGMN